MNIFVTNIPAFYKAELIDRLGERGIFVKMACIADDSDSRGGYFFQYPNNNHYFIIKKGQIERVFSVYSSIRLLRTLWNEKPDQIILSGWNRLEYWVAALYLKTRKILVLETTEADSSPSSIKNYLKKIFVARMDACIASSETHADLLRKLNYDGEILISNGVGCLELPDPEHYQRERTSFRSLLYLGRLSAEKNVDSLIRAVRRCPDVELTIAGDGPMRRVLEEMAGESPLVRFVGSVDRAQLPELFSKADAFILPSLREPWGLVLEEAAHFEVPVIVSENAGSCSYFTEQNAYGISCEPSEEGILKALERFKDEETYRAFAESVRRFDLARKNDQYVDAFVRALARGPDE